MNNRPAQVREKFEAISLSQIAISSITLFELDAGARKSQKSKENLQRLEQFVKFINVLSFDSIAAQTAGRFRTLLRSQGTPIGDMDTLIAAHVFSINATVVTNNVKEFERVPDLKIENWFS